MRSLLPAPHLGLSRKQSSGGCAHHHVAAAALGLRIWRGRCDPRVRWLLRGSPCFCGCVLRWCALGCCFAPLRLCLGMAAVPGASGECLQSVCWVSLSAGSLVHSTSHTVCSCDSMHSWTLLLAAAINSCCMGHVTWLRPASVLPLSQCWTARIQHQAAKLR